MAGARSFRDEVLAINRRLEARVLELEAAVTRAGPMPAPKGVDVPTESEPVSQEESHKSPTMSPVVELNTRSEADLEAEAIGTLEL